MQRPLAVVDGTGAAVLYVRILGKPAVCVWVLWVLCCRQKTFDWQATQRSQFWEALGSLGCSDCCVNKIYPVHATEPSWPGYASTIVAVMDNVKGKYLSITKRGEFGCQWQNDAFSWTPCVGVWCWCLYKLGAGVVADCTVWDTLQYDVFVWLCWDTSTALQSTPKTACDIKSHSPHNMFDLSANLVA